MNYLKQLFVSISNLPKNLFSAAPDEVSVPIEIEDTISRKRRRDPEDDVMEINQSPVKRSHLVTGSKVLRESCMNYSNLQKTAGTQTYGNVLLPTKLERSSSDGLQKTVDNWNSVIDDDITTWSPKQFKNKFKAPKHVRSPNKHSKSNPKAHDGTAMISIDLTSPEKTRPSTTMIASRGIFDSTRVSPKSQLFNEKQSFDDFQRLLCELLSYDTKESMKKPTAPPRIAETVDLTDETIDLTGSAALQVKPLQTSRRIGAPTVTVNPNFSFGNDDRSSSIARETTTPRSLVPRLNSFEETLNKNKYTSHVFVDLTTERYKNYLDAVKVEDERCKAKLECQKRINSTNIDELITNRLLEHCKITESSILIEDEEEKEIETVKPELTNEMMVKIRNAWNERLHPRETLVSKFKLDVTRSDLMTLKNLNWLNDAVINFYMELIAERGDSDPKYPSVYAFSTFFYPTLTKGYDRVRRYTRKVDLFSKDIILVPIHLAVHWCMAKIDMKKKKIFYYDSMKASNQKALDTLLDYLVQEHIDKKKEKFDSSEWDIINDKDIPCQRNGSDCGVFACTFGEYSARNSKFNFSQDDMQYMRQKMVVEILEGRLLL